MNARVVVRAAVAATLVLVPVRVDAQVDLRFSGFGDVVAGVTGGEYVSPERRDLFERYGEGVEPMNTNRGFGLTGVDFVVVSDMAADLKFLGEINLQAVRSGSDEIELDVERVFIDYLIDPRFNLQAGLFFTPIGFNNRFLYARAWLMNSIQVPDFYEEELNLVPTHTVGVAAHGEFFFQNGLSLNYIVSAGNGRAVTPVELVYARDTSPSKEFTGLLELLVPGYRDSRIGLSGWTGRIETPLLQNVGDVVENPQADEVLMREVGLDAYVVWNTRGFSLNAELIHSRRRDLVGNLANRDHKMTGGIAEFALHFMDGRLHPYLRYDWSDLPPEGDPYLGMRRDGDTYYRTFVPDFEAGMVGFAYDVSLHMRVKLEYLRHFDGPRRRNALAVQAAFGF